MSPKKYVMFWQGHRYLIILSMYKNHGQCTIFPNYYVQHILMDAISLTNKPWILLEKNEIIRS